MDKTDIVITGDGSSTLFNKQHGEHYHSVHGAIQESKHVFIEAGLRYETSSDQLRILEIGFGTGLNCLLSLAETTITHRDTFYYAIEPFPVDGVDLNGLNYCQFTGLSGYVDEFRRMHLLTKGEIFLSPVFQLSRSELKLEETSLKTGYFNLVYFDAFSAETQPELWQPEIFSKIRAGMAVGGILVTYAAKGYVRRGLQVSGFATERLPGPPGKREMLRATAI